MKLAIFFIRWVMGLVISLAFVNAAFSAIVPESYITGYKDTVRVKIRSAFALDSFTDIVGEDLLANMKNTVGLTDKELKTILSLDSEFIKLRQLTSHNYDSADINQTLKRCVDGSVRLIEMLGEDKFVNYQEWIYEEKYISKKMEMLAFNKVDLSEIDRTANALAMDLAATQKYKIFKGLRIGDGIAKKERGRSFSKWEDNLKRRISYQVISRKMKRTSRSGAEYKAMERRKSEAFNALLTPVK